MRNFSAIRNASSSVDLLWTVNHLINAEPKVYNIVLAFVTKISEDTRVDLTFKSVAILEAIF